MENSTQQTKQTSTPPVNNLLDMYKKQMGYNRIAIPTKFELEKVQLYNVGLFKELVEDLISLPVGVAVELNFEALTSSNISTLHTTAKMRGYKFHCMRSGPKRVLYVEKKV